MRDKKPRNSHQEKEYERELRERQARYARQRPPSKTHVMKAPNDLAERLNALVRNSEKDFFLDTNILYMDPQYGNSFLRDVYNLIAAPRPNGREAHEFAMINGLLRDIRFYCDFLMYQNVCITRGVKTEIARYLQGLDEKVQGAFRKDTLKKNIQDHIEMMRSTVEYNHETTCSNGTETDPNIEELLKLIPKHILGTPPYRSKRSWFRILSEVDRNLVATAVAESFYDNAPKIIISNDWGVSFGLNRLGELLPQSDIELKVSTSHATPYSINVSVVRMEGKDEVKPVKRAQLKYEFN